MKTNLFVILLLLVFYNTQVFSEDSIPITISSTIFWGDVDEWLHLKISEINNNKVWYDSMAIVTKAYGFQDTIYLDTGLYKCEIIDMGANVSMPIVKLDNGHIVTWGYPAYEYYLISVPSDKLNTYSTISLTSCSSYISPSSKYTWSESGSYIDTIPNAVGYDSIITINLTIISINNSVNISNGVLNAVESDANYEWLVCNSGNLIIGANDQNYTPIVSGLYSVRITKNGCLSTSACYSVLVSGINENDYKNSISVFPNPVSDKLNINLDISYSDINIEIKDLSGRIVSRELLKNENNVQFDMTKYMSGIYFIILKTDDNETKFKVLKK